MSAQQIQSAGFDPSSIQLIPVPDVWPPADQGQAAGIAPPGPPAPPAGPGGRPEGGPGPARPGRAGDDGRGWPHQFALALAEALGGDRPVRQIQPWLSRRASVQLCRVLPLFGGGHRPRVQRVMTACPAAGVIEMTIVARTGPRTRALALRLERAGPRWVCTDIEAA